MRCLSCGGEFLEERGNLTIDNNIVGYFTLNNIEYKKCNKCGKLRYPAATAKAIESKEKKILDGLLRKISVDSFIGASNAAAILGLSRQAMHKNSRINRGFIFWIWHDNRRLYLKKSVELYKSEGDGRFPLNPIFEKGCGPYFLPQLSWRRE